MGAQEMKKTIVGVDLAKKVFQVCVVETSQIISNDEMSPTQFTSWLVMAKSAAIVFECCATSNYWKQVAKDKGHDARIISAKLVSQIRQNQKTDKNDALAIVQVNWVIKSRHCYWNSTTAIHREAVD